MAARIQRQVIASTEHDEQARLIRLCDWHAPRYPALRMLYAVPNGAQRHKAVAAKLKAEGVRAGVPDLVLAAARDGYHGLYLEMKTMKGRASPQQKDWLARLDAEGYRAVMCRGYAAAWAEICDYLGIVETRNKGVL